MSPTKPTIFSLLLALTYLNPAHSNQESKFSIELNKNQTISIKNTGRIKNIKLTHTVSGYEANCKKTYLMAWGKPERLNINNPQDSTLTIINLKSKKKPISIGFSKNIFDAEFSNDEIHAVIQSDTETTLSIFNGNILTTGADIKATFKPESCDSFEFKSYRKFKE